MRSALLVRLTQSSTQRRRGKHVMMPFRDVRSKFGAALAQQILADKKALQNNKSPADPNTYFMAHPEAKDDEESHLNFFSSGLWVSTYLMLLIQLLKMWMIIYMISISNRACIQPGLIQNLGCCYPLAPSQGSNNESRIGVFCVSGMPWNLKTRMKSQSQQLCMLPVISMNKIRKNFCNLLA